MAELETIVDNEEVIDDKGADTTDAEVTYEQAMAWKKEADGLKKAEQAVVKLKKQLKDKSEVKEIDTSKYITKDEAELDRFLIKNPDLEDYKEDLSTYVAKWLSLKQAGKLVESDDKTIANRKKTNSLNLTDWESGWKSSFSVSELEKMKQADYNKAMDLIDSGKATLG